jgi:hypothetical protein
MVLADSHKIPRVPCYLGASQRDFGLFAYRTVTFYGRPFQVVQLRRSFVTLTPDGTRTKLVPRHPAYNARRLSHTRGLGCCCFARRYYSNRYYFLFLGVLRCFNSPRWLYPDYEFIRKSQDMTLEGLTHSEIPGSKDVCSSPRLIAAYRVLHRLQMPRHSPCALSSLTKIGHTLLLR